MNHNFKPGDLALVVGFVQVPDLVGSAVELVEPTYPGEQFSGPDGVTYRSRDELKGWVVLTDLDEDGWAHVAEAHLMPLRGDFVPERQKSLEVPA
ncbi:MAG: hypothetical protein G3W70_21300 [Xanthomonas perforans]|nr:hypothetical protein [Xanthomonas perforans]